MLQGKWLLKHRFFHEKEKKQNKKNRKYTTRTKKKKKRKVATPGIEFVQIKKALDFVHLQVR